MKFSAFLAIVHRHGFTLQRTRGSHRTYRGTVDGMTRIVTVACHRESDDIKPKTLASMIRQTGLPKRLFR